MPKLKAIVKELALMFVVISAICVPLYFALMEVLSWR
jgi:hypothetical protein